MANDERPVLILAPNVPGVLYTPGSVTVRADCGHDAMVSISGLALMNSEPVRTACLDCTPATRVRTATPAPGVREELTSLVGADMVEQLEADARRYRLGSPRRGQ